MSQTRGRTPNADGLQSLMYSQCMLTSNVMNSAERALMHQNTFYLLICPQWQASRSAVTYFSSFAVAFLPHQRSHFVMMSWDGLFQPLQWHRNSPFTSSLGESQFPLFFLCWAVSSCIVHQNAACFSDDNAPLSSFSLQLKAKNLREWRMLKSTEVSCISSVRLWDHDNVAGLEMLLKNDLENTRNMKYQWKKKSVVGCIWCPLASVGCIMLAEISL